MLLYSCANLVIKVASCAMPKAGNYAVPCAVLQSSLRTR